MQPYNFNEIIAITSAIAVGAGAYVSFVWKKKLEKITFPMVFSTIFISALVTYLAAEVVKIFKLAEYRSIILVPSAFMAQWFVEWVFSRYPKLFDAGLKRTTGIDITPKDEQNNMNNEPDFQEHTEGGDNP